MQAPGAPGVSVIIPAFNASRWIEKTLRSVQRQTIANIEIIVIDDGSTDDTAEIVEQAVRLDPRIRLIRQSNGGVARARNAGIAAAQAEFIAPIDADDLWHPARLERHLEAFAKAGSDVALVYSPFARIGDDDGVWYGQPCAGLEGDVFERHLSDNFIGNGSGITVRTAAAREVGGYSSQLRDAMAEGFEDWLFQLKLAYRYKFACVPIHLVAYRASPDAMSSDLLQMSRSGVLALQELAADAPDVGAAVFWLPRARASGQFVLRLVKIGAWGTVFSELARELPRNPLLLPYLPIPFWRHFIERARARAKEIIPHRKRRHVRFEDLDPSLIRPRPPTLSTRFWTAVYAWLGERRLRSAQRPPARNGELSPERPNLTALK